MGIRGEYVLTLTCDNDGCRRSLNDVTKYSGADNKAAIAAARAAGWRISSTNACCPTCVRGKPKGTKCAGS